MISRRTHLAERWRRVGQELHDRSPEAFEQVFELLAAAALAKASETRAKSSSIDFVYRIC